MSAKQNPKTKKPLTDSERELKATIRRILRRLYLPVQDLPFDDGPGKVAA